VSSIGGESLGTLKFDGGIGQPTLFVLGPILFEGEQSEVCPRPIDWQLHIVGYSIQLVLWLLFVFIGFELSFYDILADPLATLDGLGLERSGGWSFDVVDLQHVLA
jgi:hypothetical protein